MSQPLYNPQVDRLLRLLESKCQITVAVGVRLINECPIGIRGAFSEIAGVYPPYNEITDQ